MTKPKSAAMTGLSLPTTSELDRQPANSASRAGKKPSRRRGTLKILHIAGLASDVAVGRWHIEPLPNIDLVHVKNLAHALAILHCELPDAIVCAHELHDASSVTAVKHLQSELPHVPIIVVAEMADRVALTRALKAGAEDFVIAAHTDSSLMLKTIRQAISRRRAAEQVEYLSHYDRLTGLANRELFADRVHVALNRADRSKRSVGLVIIDIDRFRSVNEAFGNDVGDELLIHCAQRLRKAMRTADTVARTGSNEFSILFEDIDRDDDVESICGKLHDLMNEPVQIGDELVFLTCSIGVATHPADGGNVRALICSADSALDQARREGRNRSYRHRPELLNDAGSRARLERSLGPALRDGQFMLRYQPRMSVQTGQILGVEALLRWQHPEFGELLPTKFVALAEESGAIVALGDWVIEQACADLNRLGTHGHGELSMAINLSAQQFSCGALGERIESCVEAHRIDPNLLIFELTESTVMADTCVSAAQLDKLKAMGVMVYLDDFGTGYSSLAYLKRFCIDGLKIDREFIHDLPGNADDRAITRAIIALAHALQLGVIAEGVETRAQLDFVANEGCDEVQGWYISQALAFDELLAWCEHRGAGVPHSRNNQS